MTPSAQIRFKLPYTLTKEDGWVVSHCPILDVSSQGNDEVSAKDNLVDAIKLFIETCIEMRTVESVLEECGFVNASSSAPIDTAQSSEEDDSFLDVPIDLIIQAQSAGSPTSVC